MVTCGGASSVGLRCTTVNAGCDAVTQHNSQATITLVFMMRSFLAFFVCVRSKHHPWSVPVSPFASAAKTLAPKSLITTARLGIMALITTSSAGQVGRCRTSFAYEQRPHLVQSELHPLMLSSGRFHG